MCPKRNQDRRGPATEMSRFAGDVSHQRNERLIDLTVMEENGALAKDERTVMKTALVTIRNPEDAKSSARIRVFFDTGTSRSFLTVRTARSLGLSIMSTRTLSVNRFGNEDPLPVNIKTTSLDMRTVNGNFWRVNVAVSEKTMTKMSKVSVPEHVLKRLPRGIHLADDPLPANAVADVDLMIGNDYYDDVVGGQKFLVHPGVWCVWSEFGWMLSGRVPDYDSDLGMETRQSESCPESAALLLVNDGCVLRDTRCVASGDLLRLEDLWNLETIGIRDPPNSVSDEEAIKRFNDTVTFEGGRYQVQWPWKENKGELPSNYSLALRRLRSLLRRQVSLGRMDFLQRYNDIIMDQLKNGIIEKVAEKYTANAISYLPHHGIETPQKSTTKLRVVYDASARPSPGTSSLNECVHRGAVFLENIIPLLLRFRDCSIGITSDLEKAFLQVGLQPSERDVTRFLWVNDVRKPPEGPNLITYRFRRVSFGIKASPFLLSATILFHLSKETSEIARLIKENIYVDNVICGVWSTEEAQKFYSESKEIFRKAGMNLREFASNDGQFMAGLPREDVVSSDVVKVLGINWVLSEDRLTFRPGINSFDHQPVTKRAILSDLFRVYDPLGMVSPVLLPGKVLLQELCKRKIDWNTTVDADLTNRWHAVRKELMEIGSVSMPRYFGGCVTSRTRLIAFCDASMSAYATIVYVQKSVSGGKYASQLALAKTRVAPVGKAKMTIPRLELMGLVIAARAVETVRRALKCEGKATIFCDSKCTLQLLTSVKVTSQFVRNRLDEIRKSVDIEFRHVESKENPADLASRGCTVVGLNATWWHGPQWCYNEEQNWPNSECVVTPAMVADRNSLSGMFVAESMDETNNYERPFEISPQRYSSIEKLVRVTAWCFRACDAFRKIRVPSDNLSASETRLLLLKWIRSEQTRVYSEIAEKPKERAKQVKASLGVREDKDGILRCHGRLANMEADDGTKFPILMPSKSTVTDLLILDAHGRCFHGGIAQTLACLRRKYWIPRGRSRVRSLIGSCTVCRHAQGSAFARPCMPELPAARVTRKRPFNSVGMDYFGPVYVKQHALSEKRWICILSCLATRAIHLEVVQDMTATELVLALLRFVSRRGKPDSIVCDNAVQFRAIRNSDPFSKFSSGTSSRSSLLGREEFTRD